MCGRFTLTAYGEKLAAVFNLASPPSQATTYNIAPTNSVTAIVSNGGKQQWKTLRWGLIPHWAKDEKIGYKLINARAETVAEKPSFRTAFKKSRCLIVADGFYEWKKQEDSKQPYYFHLEKHQPFAFAGLWTNWHSPQGEDIATCTIITTEANRVVKPVHGRMPVILSPQHYQTWLDNSNQEVQSLLQPYPDDDLVAYPTSKAVNNPRHDESDCIKPLQDDD